MDAPLLSRLADGKAPVLKELVAELADFFTLPTEERAQFSSPHPVSLRMSKYTANSQYKVVRIDGERLADLMIEHDLGVSV